MKRSVQEIVELVVFGAIALLIGTGVLWLAGWIFTGLGWLSLAVSGLIWRVLIVLVPIVIVAGLIYWLATRMLQQRAAQPVAAPAAGAEPVPEDQPEELPAEPAPAAVEPEASEPPEAEDPDEWPLRNG